MLVRVIRATDAVAQLSIIRATNNQNSMKAWALRGTDDIHRQIDDFFVSYQLHYDRRPGYYKDKQVAVQSIVGFRELVQAVLAIVLHRPDDARARPGDYFAEAATPIYEQKEPQTERAAKDSEKKYHSIFGVNAEGTSVFPLGVYVQCVKLMRRVDMFLSQKKIDPGDHRNIKFYIATHVCSELTNNKHPSPEEILKIESTAVTDQVLEKSFQEVWAEYMKLITPQGVNPDSIAKGKLLLQAIDAAQSKQHEWNHEAESEKKPQRARPVRQRLKDKIRDGAVL